jgi:hypothetical protein
LPFGDSTHAAVIIAVSAKCAPRLATLCIELSFLGHPWPQRSWEPGMALEVACKRQQGANERVSTESLRARALAS